MLFSRFVLTMSGWWTQGQGHHPTPDQWSGAGSGHTVTPPSREILVPRHTLAGSSYQSQGIWAMSMGTSDVSLSVLKGVILVGPIVEHNGDINVDLQHKDCVCGMWYVVWHIIRRKGHGAGQLMDTRYWAEYRVTEWWTECLCSDWAGLRTETEQLHDADSYNQHQQLSAGHCQWAPTEKLQKMREMRINW